MGTVDLAIKFSRISVKRGQDGICNNQFLTYFWKA